MASVSSSPAHDARATLRVGDARPPTTASTRSATTSNAFPSPSRCCSRTCCATAPAAARRAEDVAALATWQPGGDSDIEIPFMPGRVLLQDFTGVPAVVDLAAMRDAMAELGGDPARINPLVPADLVIDHSVQVDRFGTSDAFAFNVEREYERNGERYQLLRWAQTALRDFRVVPPGHRHHPPGQPGVPQRRGQRARGRGRGGHGLPRHARRHRLAHHHDQRPGHPRLRRRRHRGRGRAAGPAALPAASHRRRRAPAWRPAAGQHRHRPGARGQPDAARPRRGRQVRRVLRRRPGLAVAGRPSHARQHGARVRRHHRHLPHRRRDARLPAPDRPRGSDRAGRGLRQGPGPVARARCRTAVR